MSRRFFNNHYYQINDVEILNQMPTDSTNRINTLDIDIPPLCPILRTFKDNIPISKCPGPSTIFYSTWYVHKNSVLIEEADFTDVREFILQFLYYANIDYIHEYDSNRIVVKSLEFTITLFHNVGKFERKSDITNKVVNGIIVEIAPIEKNTFAFGRVYNSLLESLQKGSFVMCNIGGDNDDDDSQ